jgi:hypothetical protein
VSKIVAVNANLQASAMRVRDIAHRMRTLKAYDGTSLPPDYGVFIAELADELALVIDELATREVQP